VSRELADDFTLWWAAHYPKAWPVGWALRLNGPRYWMTIDSLPDAHRKPVSDDDWSVLLARHRDVSNTTLGDGTECWLVIGATDRGDESRPAAWHAVFGMEALTPIVVPPLHNEARMRFAVARVDWDFDRYAPLVRALADTNDGSSLLVVNVDPGQIYAPRSGGADLFFAMFCEHDDARRRFSQWRSEGTLSQEDSAFEG